MAGGKVTGWTRWWKLRWWRWRIYTVEIKQVTIVEKGDEGEKEVVVAEERIVEAAAVVEVERRLWRSEKCLYRSRRGLKSAKTRLWWPSWGLWMSRRYIERRLRRLWRSKISL